jgi:hypothetical protein
VFYFHICISHPSKGLSSQLTSLLTFGWLAKNSKKTPFVHAGDVIWLVVWNMFIHLLFFHIGNNDPN